METSPVKRLALFAHFDKDDIVDDYVYYYLNELKQICATVHCISTAKLSADQQAKLTNLGVQVTCRPNIGYDFMSYKLGLDSHNLDLYDEVIICNDSVYGPLQPLSTLFAKKQAANCDFWGITDSYLREHHIQSYFVVFKPKAFQSDVFKQFWQNVSVLNSKSDIIEKYEIGLSRTLIADGLSFITLYQSEPRTTASIFKILTEDNFAFFRDLATRLGEKDLYQHLPRKIKNFGNRNPTHTYWHDTLRASQSPFIKIELLRDNPTNVKTVGDIIPLITAEFDYPADLILRNLARQKAP